MKNCYKKLCVDCKTAEEIKERLEKNFYRVPFIPESFDGTNVAAERLGEDDLREYTDEDFQIDTSGHYFRVSIFCHVATNGDCVYTYTIFDDDERIV